MFADGSIDWLPNLKTRPIFNCKYFTSALRIWPSLRVGPWNRMRVASGFGCVVPFARRMRRRAELRDLRVVRRQLDQQRADIAARLNHVAAADADVPRRGPLAAHAQRERTIRCARLAAAAVQRVVVAVSEQLLRQIAVVLEGVRLHEAAPDPSDSTSR